MTEHAAATVARWMTAPEAAFMVTTRERLQVVGEVVQTVEPLPLDGPAIELFIARARAVRHDFTPDAVQRSTIAEIVKLLDGLPLAIELAAARTAVLSPSQLFERLRDRFKLLAGRRGVSRQSTLRAAIDWSWQLLTDWQQAALDQCSTFEGGFTLAAAEGVVDLSSWPNAPPIVDVMQALVDKSLLRRWIPDETPRHDIDEPYFGMYLSIHEYAAQKCQAHGDVYRLDVEKRHGRYFAGFGTDEALEALLTHGGTERMRALRRELDNLALACRRAIARADASVAVACYRALWEVLAMRGPFGLAVALGDEILATPALDIPLAEQSRLVLAEALTRTGETEGLETRLTEALGRVRGIGDRKLEMRILGRLGNVCLWAGRVDEARSFYENALDGARAVGNRLFEAKMHGNLAIAHHESGRFDVAALHYETSLAMEREMGDRRNEAITLCNYADLLGAQGHTGRARHTFTEALALLRELGDRDTEAITLQQLGEYELSLGLVDEAMGTLRRALDLARSIGNTRVYGQVLRGMGGVHLKRGDFEPSRAAFDQALAIARATSNRRIEANCIASLGDLAFHQARYAEAADLLGQAEVVLREIDDRPLLADLLCTRGLVDLKRDDRAAAQRALVEAQAMADDMHTGTGSSLSRALQGLRAALST